jgi:pimeloyl-ACP methyl ester carboxylesterase
MSVRSWLILMLIAPALACSAPVGVRRASPRDVHRALTANVLSTGQPSAASRQHLHELDLFELHRSDPAAAILALRAAMLEKEDRSDLLFALAELEFHLGERRSRTDPRAHFLAAAFYAQSFITSLASDTSSAVLDPRLRLAADLYNRGITSGLATDDGEYVDLTPRKLALSFGEVALERNEAELIWAGYRMTRFVPVAELEVRGLRNRYRMPGLGAPLAASLEPIEIGEPPPGADHIGRGVRVAATVLTIFSGGLQHLEGETLNGALRLYTLNDATSVRIGETQVALEYEPTAALAFGLTEWRPWDFERAGFLSGDFGGDDARGLSMLGPYDPERIPVVLVHGTASSPGRWAEMINHLRSDRTLLADYQFWIFQYNTGNPIPFSAGLMRQSLLDLVQELDPEGDDENLRQMVVVGHSQGGLLAKLCVVDGGDAFWRNVSSVPMDALDLRPETRELIERSLFFPPLPFVERVIFIATPHGGSFLANRWFARFASGMVALPRDLVDAAGDLLVEDDDRILLRGLNAMPSSIDNMTPDNQFLRTLAQLEISSGVEAHSIIAVLPGQDDPESGHDGVVTLESARIGGVESELIVRSGHSTQSHPLTIREVRRILRAGR